MGLFDAIRGQFVDIIEGREADRQTVAWRFERWQDEIKQGARLIVREGQAAIFVDQGRVADVFTPGHHVLYTNNLPILSTLRGWKHGFESPYKAEVYFVSLRDFNDLKWGTRNPVLLRDAEFGAVRLRGFGTWGFRVEDPATLLKQVIGTDGRLTAEEVAEPVRNLICSRIPDAIAEARIPALDLATRQDELGAALLAKLQGEVAPYGIVLTRLLVENLSLPPEVEAAIDKRGAMGAVGNLDAFAKYQAATAIPDAARAPGGLAGAGLGLAVGQQMAQAFAGGGIGAAPPPLPGAAAAWFAALDGQQAGPFAPDQLRQLVAAGRLTAAVLVWKQGLPAWAPAGQVAELAGLFAAPPPLPGGGTPPPLPR